MAGSAAAAGTPQEQVVEAYGARLALSSSDSEILARVLAGLPPGWERCRTDRGPDSVAWRIAVSRQGAGYMVREEMLAGGAGDASSEDWPPDEFATSCADLDLAKDVVRKQIRRHVAYHARGRVFVHAGVVAHRGRAIVIPGRSFSGKSTLVAALVRAGAAYYSDEYAILDEQGRVNRYLEPLSLRDRDGERLSEVTVESLGGRSGEAPVPIGVLAITSYAPGSDWDPRPRSTGTGVVAMMEHAVAGRNRPAEALRTIRRAVRGALVLEGVRGEAETAAAALLAAAWD